jgi:hypothetical protein
MKYFKIQSFWSDDCTFPDPLDNGEIVEANDIDDAVKEALKNIKPQVKPYLEREDIDESLTILRYYPHPSKNRNGYTETVEITEVTQEEFTEQQREVYQTIKWF